MSVLLFAGQRGHERGGWDDFIDEYRTVDKAQDRIDRSRVTTVDGTFRWAWDWAQIVRGGRLVARFNNGSWMTP